RGGGCGLCRDGEGVQSEDKPPYRSPQRADAAAIHSAASVRWIAAGVRGVVKQRAGGGALCETIVRISPPCVSPSLRTRVRDRASIWVDRRDSSTSASRVP